MSKVCNNCGQTNADWATSCGRCGVSGVNEDKYCTQCNKVLPVHTTWCQFYDQLPGGMAELPVPEINATMVEIAERYAEKMEMAKRYAEQNAALSPANAIQIGGEHYKKGGEEHWDRAWRLNYDPFQYIITKWVERWKDKGGVEDLKKAQHAIQKYIEVVSKDSSPPPS